MFDGWIKDIPAGSFTFDKSQSASVFLNSSYTPTGKSCLGMSDAIESAFCVGAAKRVAGAKAKTRLRVVVKIIFACRFRGKSGSVRNERCLVDVV